MGEDPIIFWSLTRFYNTVIPDQSKSGAPAISSSTRDFLFVVLTCVAGTVDTLSLFGLGGIHLTLIWKHNSLSSIRGTGTFYKSTFCRLSSR